MEESGSGEKLVQTRGIIPKNPVTCENPMMGTRKPLAPIVVLPQIPKNNLTLEEKVDYLERMMLMQSKQITRILEVLTED